MTIEEMLQNLAESDTPDDHDKAMADFAAACWRADHDPREGRRIRDIAALLDAENTIYDQAVAALDRGDTATARPLLELAAEADVGEAAWLLASLLEGDGQDAEALTWYQRAADDGDSRAYPKLAALRMRGSLRRSARAAWYPVMSGRYQRRAAGYAESRPAATAPAPCNAISRISYHDHADVVTGFPQTNWRSRLDLVNFLYEEAAARTAGAAWADTSGVLTAWLDAWPA